MSLSSNATQTIDPNGVSRLVNDGYRRYLASLMPLRDPELSAALNEQINTSELLSKGPLLETTPSYAQGATPRQLREEGVLSPGFTFGDKPQEFLDRALYQHQEEAIRKAKAGRNLIVATGTGSGKTEGFLVPIVDALEEERVQGTLGPGVRAILLYPMNALANDQLKRLREELLVHNPHITCGRYTGETKPSEEEAHKVYRAMHETDPLPNEMLSRERMRATPPHLLLTNYAMLEYLLLRPGDLALFDGEHSGHWRFIALDEAHTYDGAKAAEIAMLLRRLRDRVAPDQRLQCIATSATLGRDPARITEFGSRLFDESFEWVDGDPGRQDLVRATHSVTEEIPGWGPLPVEDYADILSARFPEDALRKAAARYGARHPDPAVLLSGERRMHRLRRALDTGPRFLPDLVTEVFHEEGSDDPSRIRDLAALVTLGDKVYHTAGSPLLSARYHLFTRDTDGAFTCLGGDLPHVSLARHETCEICGSPTFELGSCQRCGDVYLVGTVSDGHVSDRFLPQRSPRDPLTWLHLGPTVDTIDEDDRTLEPDTATSTSQSRYLCTGCGTLHRSSKNPCPGGCPGRSLREVQQIRCRSNAPTRCLKCGAQGNPIRRFQSGGDASAAVVATALYQTLPEDPRPHVADQPGGGRKLLMFSDSRQGAAFFAPYLEQTYQGLQRRRLILQGLQALPRVEDGFSVKDLVHATVTAADRATYFRHTDTHLNKVNRITPWVMSELVSKDRRSLEGCGLISVGILRPRAELPAFHTARSGLTGEEVWNVLEELARTMRQQGVLSMPENVPAGHEIFKPRLGPIYMRETGSDAKRKVLSWLATQGVNSRSDYLRRLLARTGSEQEPDAFLDGAWKFLRDTPDGWLLLRQESTIGTVYQLDHSYLRIFLTGGGAPPPYQCDSCLRLHHVSVRGVCPTINCPGTLHPFEDIGSDRDHDHYRHLYRTLAPVPLRAMEHTAQWAPVKAAEVQGDFIKGRVNALSCSTTFELGVDVGDLQTVLMRNMPPTTANYVQRAGRAGRRTDSAALVVTHARRRAHDLFRYQDPKAMISGKMPTPYVPLTNERIDRRHAHSVALSLFFRHWYELTQEDWKKVGSFMLSEEEQGPAPVMRVRGFLDPVPAEITESLRRVLPEEVAARIDVEGETWASRLAEMLEKLSEEVAKELDFLEERRLEAFRTRKSLNAYQIERTMETVRERSLLGYLATHNVLPKYGFPVDTVELRTSHSTEATGRDLDLARDLTSAIHEYAPGASIVAGGRLWTSGGVYRMPGRGLVERYYRLCEACGYYEEDEKRLGQACASCGTVSSRAAEVYVIPEFGFVAKPKSSPAGTEPPKRLWNGFAEVVRLAEEPRKRTWNLANGHTAHCVAGSRGELVTVSQGQRSGYHLCQWCGWGISVGSGRLPTKHESPLTGKPCKGTLEQRSLGHRYETDLLSVSFNGSSTLDNASSQSQQSLLYALLEGASAALEISRNDIGGTVSHRKEGHNVLVLFDTVPGGAGGALRIAENFDRVLESARTRVRDCDCGIETSCYGCLRSYRNQHVHDLLYRRNALAFLEDLLPVPE